MFTVVYESRKVRLCKAIKSQSFNADLFLIFKSELWRQRIPLNHYFLFYSNSFVQAPYTLGLFF